MAIMTFIRIAVAGLLTIIGSVGAILVLLVRSAAGFHVITRSWARIVLKVFGVSVSVEGSDHIVPNSAYIYVANHASMFDIPAVLAGIPDDIHIMLKKELTRVPIWGWALAMSPYIVIDRFKGRSASESLQEAAEAIRSGKSVLIFAEGTRTHSGSLLPFKRGAFSVAARSGIPIIPIAINNTFSILQKGSLNITAAPITIRIGSPIDSSGGTTREDENRLLEETRKQIETMYIEQHE